MDSPQPPPGTDPLAGHIAHLESQLLISEATHAEELSRLRDELEGVYSKCEGLKRDAAQGRTRGGGAGAAGGDEQLRQMQQTISTLQNDNTHLEQTLQSLHAQHAHLLASHTQTLSTLRGAEIAYDTLHTSHTTLETQQIDLRAELEDLQERFTALERREGSLRQDWEILGEDYADLKDEIGLVHGEKRGLKSTIEEQQTRIVQLEDAERTARDTADDVRAELGTAHRTSSALRTRLEALEALTAGLEARAEGAERERLEVQVERVEATLARDAAEDKVEGLEGSVRHLEATVSDLQTTLSALRAHETTWLTEKDTLVANLAAVRAENSKLEIRAEKYRTEEGKLKAELKTLKTERTALQKRLKEAEKDGKHAEATWKEVTRLEEEVLRLERERGGVQERVEELEKEVKKWEEECGRKEDEVMDLEGAVHEAKDALATAKQAIATAETTHKSSLDRIIQLETTVGKQKTSLAEKESTITALQRRVTSLTADVKRMTAEVQATKKEIVPLRLERDALKNETKKLGSERNLLRHNLDKLQREGGAAPSASGTASATTTATTAVETTPATASNGPDAFTALQAEHAVALATHAADIARRNEEREEFKKYIDWVRPDREKLKEELKNLHVAFEHSEAEKKMLMSEVTKYLSQQPDTKPVITPIAGKASPMAVPPVTSPIKNGQQQHEQLVQALGIIEQEFTRYRTRVEEELAEGKSAIAQAERERSMVEEEFQRFRREQTRAREALEREVGKYKHELEKKQQVSRVDGSKGFAETSQVVPPLTREIHATIAGFLAGANAFRSLAHFSAVSREVRQTIMPILYETLVLDDDGDEDWAYGIRVDLTAGLVLPSGWEFVQ